MLKVCDLLDILSQRLAMIYHQIRAQKTRDQCSTHLAMLPVLFTNSAVCVSAAILWLTIGIANTVKN